MNQYYIRKYINLCVYNNVGIIIEFIVECEMIIVDSNINIAWDNDKIIIYVKYYWYYFI